MTHIHTLDLDPIGAALAPLLSDGNWQQSASGSLLFGGQGRLSSLRTILKEQAESAACLKAARTSTVPRILLLRSANPAFLNLPWRLAFTEFPWVYVVCSPIISDEKAFSPSPASMPLRVLVMVSAPVDMEPYRKLNYEEEERLIIQALSPLVEKGQVYLDFTEDGSLDALRRKLAELPYHVLHFSGHGTFREGTGYLELETPGTLKSVLTPAPEFVETLTHTPQHTPPLVVLSACKTSQGTFGAEQTGLSSALTRAGVAAVIAMNEGIRDDYATAFASRLHEFIADKHPLHEAFKSASERIRGLEYEEYRGAIQPFQWLIPELQVAEKVPVLVDFKGEKETIQPQRAAFQLTEAGMALVREVGTPFIGRRKERSRLLAALHDAKPVVLIRGMGGVGKTALAAQLLNALKAETPQPHCVTLNEISFTPSNLFKEILDLLPLEHKRFVESELEGMKETGEQVATLLNTLASSKRVAFVFDNLETFQQGPGEPFKEEYAEQEQIIRAFLSSGYRFPLILTSRYPLSGMEGIVAQDLHQSSLNDFWKKSLHIHLYQHYQELTEAQAGDFVRKVDLQSEPQTYLGFVASLHEVLGGNYRLLEYFDGVMRERPEKLTEALRGLSGMGAEFQAARDQMATHERNPLVLSELLRWLSPTERQALDLLRHFRIPVTDQALNLQHPDSAWLPALEALGRMTLAERSEGAAGQIFLYAVPPLKDLLRDEPPPLPLPDEQARRYYRYAHENLGLRGTTQQEEAFYHYCLGENQEQVAKLGETLVDVYYHRSQYRQAHMYAITTEQVVGDGISAKLRNRLGLLFHRFGDYSRALSYYKMNLLYYCEADDKPGEGSTLNNIGLIYKLDF